MSERGRESERAREVERAKEVENERAIEAAGGENARRAENRRKRKTRCFGVESKSFEMEMVERGGKTLITITESKKGVSSWVRMGTYSVGLLMEGLHQCIKDAREERWEKNWKEKGRSFSLVRATNRGGCFLRLGVVDLEMKRYSICIPKGKGDKGGWMAMVEALHLMDPNMDKKVQQEATRTMGRPSQELVKGRSFADMVKGGWNKGSKKIRVEVGQEECCRNLSRLEHCLIGKWSPSNTIGGDLEHMGREMAKIWGLKGKMGMARLGTGRVLLEFELAEEARRVLLSGNKVVGGVHMILECWNPRLGCVEEGEIREEVWVRILGLPISLWVPSVLRKVGDACGGFLDVDPQTESMEELQWAKILVRSDGEGRPDILEIGVEEMTYSLTLWWESLPVLRLEEGGNQGLWCSPRREEGGDEYSRAGPRVEETTRAGVEVLRQSEDVTGCLLQEVGSAVMGSQPQVGFQLGSGSKNGPLAPGRETKRAYGPSTSSVSDILKGGQIGPRQASGSGRASDYGLGHNLKGKATLAQKPLLDNGLILKIPISGSNGHIKVGNLESDFVRCREEEMGRRQQPDPNQQWAEKMLEEEAARYDLEVNLGGIRAQGSSSSNLFCFGRTPERECYDHSGVQREGILVGSGSRKPSTEEYTGRREGCWDLIEVNSVNPMGRNAEWNTEQSALQEHRMEDQLNWEESSLVKFSHFLGFSTDGLEKDILAFLGKIRKRREKIIDKGLLETSRFERELKRLECTVNYEGDPRKKGPLQGRGYQSTVAQ